MFIFTPASDLSDPIVLMTFYPIDLYQVLLILKINILQMIIFIFFICPIYSFLI